ncbi:MAG: efflux RND transporter periplasmic adaptor subunit [Phycisphaerales bacterium]|nr:MAG: efflux RND transporter periplasmic adaptor subunit [Phycisphaerales bacterium]
MKKRTWTRPTTMCTLMVLLSLVGCKKEEHSGSGAKATGVAGIDSGRSVGPASSPVEPTLDEGWCNGHGVPESVCTRCNASLVSRFKQAGDWCAEHGLPESQCTICDSEVEAQWAKLNPGDVTPPESRSADPEGASGTFGPEASPGEPSLDEGWCNGHGVPESVCTRCNAALISKFKEAGDWCTEHGLPETQCTVCHPEVEAEWAKLNPAAQKENQRGDATGADRRFGPPKSGRALVDNSTDMRIERATRLLTGSNDPLCQVENLRVRFIDPSIIQKAGIEVERVRRRPMSATIDVPAEVEFDATRVTRITPRLAGVALDVPANVGAEVEVGDLLAIVDSPVLGEAKSQYIERVQNLKLAEADAARVNTIFRGVQRMLEVCTPQAEPEKVRGALAESPVGEAKAKLLRAHAALLLARSEAAREATLQEKKLNSERDYQAAQSAMAAAEANFVAIREETVFNAERERLAADRALEVARSSLESAERRLRILGLGEEQVGAIGTEPDELLSRFELRSPVPGYVVERSVAAGEAVEARDVLFVVTDISTMWLMADLYERDLVQMRIGLPVFFTVDGLPGASFEGSLTWISRQVDDRTRTVRVRADLPNRDDLLRAKMFGRARIVLHDNEEVVTVPSSAVQTDGCCQLVFVQESDTVFQPRKIVLGASASGVVEVLKGLQENEVVASTGSFLMKTEILKSNIGAGCCEVDPGR